MTDNGSAKKNLDPNERALHMRDALNRLVEERPIGCDDVIHEDVARATIPEKKYRAQRGSALS